LLSIARTRSKGHGKELLAKLRLLAGHAPRSASDAASR
jgi:hypothetical protein